MAAATLDQAAGQAFDNLLAKWVAGTLKTNITAFAVAALPIFPDAEPGGRPVSNWLIPLSAIAARMTSGNSFNVVPYSDMNLAAQYLYRLCAMASELQTMTSITAGQVTQLLAAYNTNFT